MCVIAKSNLHTIYSVLLEVHHLNVRESGWMMLDRYVSDPAMIRMCLMAAAFCLY